MSNGPRALIVGHAEFAAGMVSAVDQITGRGDMFFPISNTGLEVQAIEDAIRERLAAGGVAVVFSDLPAGSATIAARRALRDNSDVILVSGVNLATLLDFVFHTDGSAAEAAAHAVEKGRASLTVLGVPRGN